MSILNERFDQRSRRAVTLGLAIAMALLCYALLWLPLERQRQRLERQHANLSETYQWINQRAEEAKKLLSSAPAKVTLKSDLPLLTLVDRSSRQAGVGDALSDLEPVSHNRVKIHLKNALFDDAMGWLQALEASGVEIEQVTISRNKGQSGRSDLSARLSYPAG